MPGPKTVITEDGIMRKNEPAAAGSRILENFISPIEATVTERLTDGGYGVAGRAVTDEFGIAPLAPGSWAISDASRRVADREAGFCLCNDVFGKQRKLAAENGLFYIRPTYGTVSRYGLIPTVPSMDVIGVVCAELSAGFDLLRVIAGNDPNDGAMFPEKAYDYQIPEKKPAVALPGSIIAKADAATRAAIKKFAGNFETADVELKYFGLCGQTAYILGSAEISGVVSRYDGLKFGYRAEGYGGLDDLYIKTRSGGFGYETKLAAVVGSMVLSRGHYANYYEKAMKLRRLIKESMRFDDYDLIVLPCAIGGDPYEDLPLYALANLAGLPSVSFRYENAAIQLIAGVKNEGMIIKAAREAGIW